MALVIFFTLLSIFTVLLFLAMTAGEGVKDVNDDINGDGRD